MSCGESLTIKCCVETSYSRHILYCRRAQNRPRTRARSCRACSIAKAKCSFEPQCSRCTNKGLECVYDRTSSSRRDQAADVRPAQINAPAFSPASSTGDDFTLNNLFASGGATDTDEAQVDMSSDTMGFGAADMLPQTPKSNLPRFHEPAPTVMSNGAFLGTSNDRNVVNGLPTDFDPANFSLTEPPWSAWTTRDDYSQALFRPSSLSDQQDSDFLARLPISDSVTHFIATVVMQKLRAFPQMMLRRETLPSFIHGHWYRPLSPTELALPEPLVNCIGIAQVFASHNAESKPFLWRTVKTEQRSFIEKVRSLVSFP